MVATLVTLEKILKKTLLRRQKHCMNILSKLLTTKVLLSWHTTRSSQTLWEWRFETFDLTFLLWHTLLTSWSSKIHCVKRLVHGFENKDVNAFSCAQSSSTSSFPLACRAFQCQAFSHTQSPITHKLNGKQRKSPKINAFSNFTQSSPLYTKFVLVSLIDLVFCPKSKALHPDFRTLYK
jgi:hypothetical protein